MKTHKALLTFSFLLASFGAFAQPAPEYGLAVFYADYFDGQETAYFEFYDKYAMTCAHKTHGPGTLLKVTRTDNDKWVIVRVNDRGPYTEGRIVDLSWAAAFELDLVRDGMAPVKVEVIGYATTNPPSKYAHLREREENQLPQSYSEPSVVNGYKGTGISGENASVKSLAPGATGWSVQVASYTNEVNAIRQVQALQRRGVPDVYLKVTSDNQGGKLYKIVSGRFSGREAADAHLGKLRSDYQVSGFVLKL